MKSRIENTKEIIEAELLALLGDKRSVTITRPVLMDITGVSARSIVRTNKWLETSGRWEVTRGSGRDETVYRLTVGD